MKVLASFVVLVIAGCHGATSGTAVVSGSLVLPGDAAGKSWGVALSRDGSEAGIVAQVGAVADSGLRIAYHLDKVPAGSYFLLAWAGAGGDNADTHPMGDLYGVWSDGDQPSGTPNFKIADGQKLSADIYMQTLEPDDYPDVSGTVTLPSATPGKPYYVFIDTSTDSDDGYLDMTSGTVGDVASFSYRISNIPPGTGYFVYAWVDQNENGAIDDGDLIGYHGGVAGEPPASGDLDLPMPAPRGDAGDTTADITVAQVTHDLSGTVKLPDDNPHNGSKYKIYIDDDANIMNGVKATRTGTVPRSGASLSFKVPNLPAGTYYIAALVDVDGDGAPSKGDLWGYYMKDNTISNDSARDSFVMGDADASLAIGELHPVKAIVSGTLDAGSEAAGYELRVGSGLGNFPIRFTDIDASQGKLDDTGKGSYYLVNGFTGDVFMQAVAFPKPADVGTLHPVVNDFFAYAGSDDAAGPATAPNIPDGGGMVNIKLVKITNAINGKITGLQSNDPCTLAIATQAGSLSAGAVRTFTAKTCTASSFAAYNLPIQPLFLTMWQDVNSDGMQNMGDLLGYFNADTLMMPPVAPSSGLTITDGQVTTAIDLSLFEVM